MSKITRGLKIGYFALIVLMFTAWLVRYSMLGGNKISPGIEKAVVAFAEFPNKVFTLIKPGANIDKRYIPDTGSKTGISYFADTSALSHGYLLVSTLNQDKNQECKLLDLRKNRIIKTWLINTDTILRYTRSANLNRNNLRLIHPLLLTDSSLIFNTEYSLIKIDKKSKVVWANRNIFHHSIEYLNSNLIWACTTIVNKTPVYMFTAKDTLVNDGIAEVNSGNGNIVYQKSIYSILNDNGYKYLMAIGNFENDEFHLNEVNPAPADTKYWKKGDLLISLRHRNTVFLYRPATNKILWLKTGPWANQHSCTFVGDDKIMVLGNDVMRSNDYVKLLYKYNNIYLYNFKNNTIDTPYVKMISQLGLKTYTEGRCNILPGGDVFFDETNEGKLYIFNADKLKMKYCERIDDKHIKMMSLVRYIPQ